MGNRRRSAPRGSLWAEPARAALPAALGEPVRLFGDKYTGGHLPPDGRHGWLRIVPEKLVSWDFRKAG